MKTHFSILAIFLLSGKLLVAQDFLKNQVPGGDTIAWNNYSTTWLGDAEAAGPLVVTAIPYNGMYHNFEDAGSSLDLSFEGSLFRFRSNQFNQFQRLFTFDSADVYFLAANINRQNADRYEYRISRNAKTVVADWQPLTKFSDLKLNPSKNGFGFLGGFKAPWGEFVTAELRRKGSDSVLSAATVQWKMAKPEVVSVYTSKNLNEFFALLQRSWNKGKDSAISPKNLLLPSTENTLIFCLSADVFKKEAVEYQLLRDNKVVRDWGPNEFDNNFIWLKDFSPGKYRLRVRYSKQRHNVATYDFEVSPAWHQTTGFKLLLGSLTAAFFGFLWLLFRLQRLKQRTVLERLNRDKAALELKSVYAQLNPHFIFNSLSSIQGLINKADPAGANKYLVEFSALLRSALAQANKEWVTLEEEVQTLNRYLQLEQLRFGFRYEITVDPNLVNTGADLPPLLLQPLVENAVKHGVAGMQQEGFIQICFKQESDDLIVRITDNGKGMTAAGNRFGYGLKLTSERIELHNGLLPERKIELQPLSSSGGQTTVALRFKNWWS